MFAFRPERLAPTLNRQRLLRAATWGGLTILGVAVARAGVPYLSPLVGTLLVAAVVVVLLWLTVRAYRAFLWKVGRRLAFSYFLVGVLPIPLVALLLAVGAYLLSGFFLGHLYRDASLALHTDLKRSAEIALHTFEASGQTADALGETIAFSYYREGQRVGGDARAPLAWPGWLAESSRLRAADDGREAMVPFITRSNGAPTFAVAVGSRQRGVVAVWVGDIEREISERSGVWTEFFRPEDQPQDKDIQIQVLNHKVAFNRLRTGKPTGDAAKFFKRPKARRFWDDPILAFGEFSGSLTDLESGEVVADRMLAVVRSTPRNVQRHFFSSSAEIDAGVWGATLVVAFLLFDIYFVATLLASVLIFGISRAVNRLSRATTAIQQGDFSVRLPVRRKDQIGALERSFNRMAENLEQAVDGAAQKELLDKELALARDLQKSLLPASLPSDHDVEFATLFAPSAAIGGDYFDVVAVGERELAVFIADVSGHGLAAGLRMAMLKASLQVLLEQARDPEEILRRLDRLVRLQHATRRRDFVTATLAQIDLENGILTLTNAGHPPTYLVRGDAVEEILLPGAALGSIGTAYGRATRSLEALDFVVWLSDGLIEATNAANQPFGYEQIVATLGGRPAASAAELRGRLLAAVERHVDGKAYEDDRTLVVLQFRPALAAAPSESAPV